MSCCWKSRFKEKKETRYKTRSNVTLNKWLLIKFSDNKLTACGNLISKVRYTANKLEWAKTTAITVVVCPIEDILWGLFARGHSSTVFTCLTQINVLKVMACQRIYVTMHYHKRNTGRGDRRWLIIRNKIRNERTAMGKLIIEIEGWEKLKHDWTGRGGKSKEGSSVFRTDR